MALNPDHMSHNGTFASEYDSLLWDLAQIILLRVNAGRSTRHEALYAAIDQLTPQHIEAANRFAADLERLKTHPPAQVVAPGDLAKVFAVMDRLAAENSEEARRIEALKAVLR
jgi:hypothetical protein